jgi:hypothetical protein
MVKREYFGKAIALPYRAIGQTYKIEISLHTHISHEIAARLHHRYPSR